MRRYFSHSAAVLLASMTVGCSAAPSQHNLTPAMLDLEPSVRVEKDPSFDNSGLSTFTLVPASELSESSRLKRGVAEKQMLFQLRNWLEGLGYRFVDSIDQADLIATIDADASYHELDVPPTLTSVPRYIPGATISTYGSIYGDVWGSYTETTYVPGRVTWETAVRPGYTVGHFYPTISVTIADRRRPDVVWAGCGTGSGTNADFRVSGQFVLAAVMSRFPQCDQRRQNYAFAYEAGHDGSYFVPMTADGNDIYPTIIQVDAASPAKRAGLRMFDMLIAANGIPLQNKSSSELMRIFAGPPGETITYTVRRLDRVFEVTVVRGPPVRE